MFIRNVIKQFRKADALEKLNTIIGVLSLPLLGFIVTTMLDIYKSGTFFALAKTLIVIGFLALLLVLGFYSIKYLSSLKLNTLLVRLVFYCLMIIYIGIFLGYVVMAIDFTNYFFSQTK